jgi:hypothetical protein
VITSIIALFNGVRLVPITLKLVFGFLWTMVLSWLCSKGFTAVSWFLVLLPYIVIALAMFKIYHLTDEQKQLLKSLQMESAVGQEGMTKRQPPSRLK